MKFFLIASSLTSIFFTLTPSFASPQWTEVGTSKAGDKLLIGNMWRDGGVVKFWQTIVNPNDDRVIAGLIEANCQTGQYQVVQITDGNKLFTQSFPVQQARLGTLDAAGISYVCAKTGE